MGIVRLSGPEAVRIVAETFVSSRGRVPGAGKQRIFHGHIRGSGGETLDEVLVHLMRAPHSYTREDVVEVNCHGGAAPPNAVLEEMLRHGARLARPGEFTQRAFLNGRIDLVQAEAVIDQIRARTRAGLQAANSAASGVLSRTLGTLRGRLHHALAHIEAAIDFPDDDLPELVNGALFQSLEAVHADMQSLLATSETGRLVREGASAAIAGLPNVGKSSLFNALLRDARAIVSAQPGTTRDRIEEYITIAGVPVKLIDTAGVRVAESEVEEIGVTMARDTLRAANLVLLVLDASQPYSKADEELAAEAATLDTPVVLVLNKSDLAPQAPAPEWPHAYAAVCQVSAATGAGLEDLEAALGRLLLGGVNLSAGEAMLNRMHQKDSLRRAAGCVGRLLAERDMSPEFLALELQQALHALGEITGETTPEDILETIFSSFCIGK